MYFCLLVLCGTKKSKQILTSMNTLLLDLCSGFTVALQSHSNFNINQGVVEQNILQVRQLACCADGRHSFKGFHLEWFYWGGMRVSGGLKQIRELRSEMGSGGIDPKNSRWEVVWKPRIFVFPECWRAGSLFPVAVSEGQSLSKESVNYDLL